MKDEMFTYHYYKNKSISKENKIGRYIFQIILFCGLAYLGTTLLFFLQ